MALARAFLRFAVVGAIATAIHAAVFALLVEATPVDPVVATVAADRTSPPGAWWRNHRNAVWLCGAKVRRRVAS